MEPGVVWVIGHRNPDTDSVCSAIGYAALKNALGELNVRPARAGELNAETAFVLQRFQVPVPELLTDAAGLDLILVDHNEVGQALPRINEARIHEVWEHHRIGDLRIPRAILFHCEPVGATSTLVAEQYFARGLTPAASIAGVLFAAILSDTLVFRSPTTTPKDRTAAGRLGMQVGLEPEAFGAELLRVKATATAQQSPAQLVRADLKEFVFGGRRVAIAQTEVPRLGALAPQKAAILLELRALREASGLVQAILMITGLEDKASELWFEGEHPELFERAFGPLQDQAVLLPNVMSRKQQVVPRLEAAFRDGHPP